MGGIGHRMFLVYAIANSGSASLLQGLSFVWSDCHAVWAGVAVQGR